MQEKELLCLIATPAHENLDCDRQCVDNAIASYKTWTGTCAANVLLADLPAGPDLLQEPAGMCARVVMADTHHDKVSQLCTSDLQGTQKLLNTSC